MPSTAVVGVQLVEEGDELGLAGRRGQEEGPARDAPPRRRPGSSIRRRRGRPGRRPTRTAARPGGLPGLRQDLGGPTSDLGADLPGDAFGEQELRHPGPPPAIEADDAARKVCRTAPRRSPAAAMRSRKPSRCGKVEHRARQVGVGRAVARHQPADRTAAGGGNRRGRGRGAAAEPESRTRAPRARRPAAGPGRARRSAASRSATLRRPNETVAASKPLVREGQGEGVGLRADRAAGWRRGRTSAAPAPASAGRSRPPRLDARPAERHRPGRRCRSRGRGPASRPPGPGTRASRRRQTTSSDADSRWLRRS